MWLVTSLGVFSMIRTGADRADGTISLRARNAGDLGALRAVALPELGPAAPSAFGAEARAPRAAVAAALLRLAEGPDAAGLINRPPPAAAPAEPGPPAAYGGVLLDQAGRLLLPDPAGPEPGRAFAEGPPNPAETPEQAALRAVREQTGYAARILGCLPGLFGPAEAPAAYFVMAPFAPRATAGGTDFRWTSANEAEALIRRLPDPARRPRDLAVLEAARLWSAAHPR
jgi:ADP-ribose pyrophosphatase YjhB (NUDIX family)